MAKSRSSSHFISSDTSYHPPIFSYSSYKYIKLLDIFSQETESLFIFVQIIFRYGSIWQLKSVWVFFLYVQCALDSFHRISHSYMNFFWWYLFLVLSIIPYLLSLMFILNLCSYKIYNGCFKLCFGHSNMSVILLILLITLFLVISHIFLCLHILNYFVLHIRNCG